MKTDDLPIETEERLLLLLGNLCDETVAPEEFEELQQILLKHPQARDFLRGYANLHVTLRDGMSDAAPLSFSSNAAPPPPPITRFLMIAAACLAAVGLSVRLLQPAPETTTETEKVPTAEIPGSVETAEVPPAPAVIVISGDEQGNESLAVGIRPQFGRLQVLAAGRVRMAFREGAVMEIVGPTTFVIESPTLVALKSGKVAVDVHAALDPFVITCEDARYAQSDGEFSVSIAAGGSHYRVSRGSLVVRSQHASEQPRTVLAGASGTMGTDAQNQDSELERFASMDLQPVSNLTVPQAYADLVITDGAVGYWRFEKGEKEAPLNSSADKRLRAQVHGASIIEAGPSNHALHLSGTTSLLSIRNPSNVLDTSNYTVETMISPKSIHLSRIFSAVRKTPNAPDSFDDPRPDWSLFSIGPASASYRKNYGKFRFHTAGWNLDGEWDVMRKFTREDMMPQQWTHVAITRTPKRITLYLNGNEAAVLKLDKLREPEPPLVAFFIGNTVSGREDRPQFQGFVDEVSVYPTALSRASIQKHYALIRPLLEWQASR